MRLGIQAQTVAMNVEKVFAIEDRIFVGLTGLASDVLSVKHELEFKANLYRLDEGRDMSPTALTGMISHMLYEKRFGPWFTEPIVAGLDENDEPYLSGSDLIGAPIFTKDFVTAGTCSSNLNGACEAFYKPDMEPEELFEAISQALLASVDRDALSGWGAVVHIM